MPKGVKRQKGAFKRLYAKTNFKQGIYILWLESSRKSGVFFEINCVKNINFTQMG